MKGYKMDYSQGKIYSLVSSHTSKKYIGSTTEMNLSDRFKKHKSQFKKLGDNYDNSARDILKYDDVRIELVENYPCSSKKELRSREQYWIDFYSEEKVNIYDAICDLEERKRQKYLWCKQRDKKIVKCPHCMVEITYGCYTGGHKHRKYHLENLEKCKLLFEELPIKTI